MGQEPSSPRPRREDPALVTGRARFTDDLSVPNLAHAALLRSRFGHARIRSIDTRAAEAIEGVIGVFTWADIHDSPAPGRIHAQRSLPVSDAVPTEVIRELRAPPRPILAEEFVRYHGEPMAVVVAEDRYTARDARDRIEVEYDRLDSVASLGDARTGSTAIHDAAPDNVGFEWAIGDRATVDEAFESAAEVVEIETEDQRLVPTPIEPRAVLVEPEADGGLTVRMPSQIPHKHRGLLSDVLGLSESAIRVVVPDIGGGFGGKMNYYPAEPAVAWAALRTERPVTWQATRSESFLADGHGRAVTALGELALSAAGDFTALRVEAEADLGAYTSRAAPTILTEAFGSMLSGQYAIPAIRCHITGRFTNRVPTAPYRGTSRPEALFLLERLVRTAASALDMDPAELRRRNLVPEDAFPYQTAVGPVYDSGAYQAALDRALELVDYQAYRSRRSKPTTGDRRLGIGIACVLDEAGTPHPESGLLRMHPSGSVTAYVGTMDQGQGHATTFADMIADRLGLPAEDIDLIEGDTDAVPQGTGTFGSRSTVQGGNALAISADKLIEQGRRIAARRMEVAPEDVEFADGEYHVAGAPDQSMTLVAVAEAAHAGGGTEQEPGLEATTFYDPDRLTFPFSTHVAVVSVDVETGEVAVERYVAIDDCGEQLNPMIVEGQVHGGVVQGLGQALFEGAEYDETGTLLTGSLMDYAIPRAASVPDLTTDTTVTPSPTNPLGVKGIGEEGTVAAPAAIVNAVCDALATDGVTQIERPVTPEVVWRALRAADR